MTKAFKLNWHRSVPEELQKGTFVDRWTEVSEIGLQTCTLYFFSWLTLGGFPIEIETQIS